MIALKPALRALPWLVIGGCIAAAGAFEARQPDSVLAGLASCRDYTATDTRMWALALTAWGGMIALCGLCQIWRWLKLLRAGAA